jgi:hypothetical protein
MRKTKKQIALEKEAKALDKFFQKAYALFDKWDDRNNKGQKWENGLGPRSRTIRKNLFIAGLIESKNFWRSELRRQLKKKG